MQAEQIRHQVYVRRYSSGVVKRMTELLSAADTDLQALIQQADFGTKTRLEAALVEIRALNRDLWAEFSGQLEQELIDFGEYEAEWQAGLIGRAIGEVPAIISPDTVKALVTARPFQGKYLKEWTKSLTDAQYQRVRDAVRIGVTNGQTTLDIAKEVIGTKSRRYNDGRLKIGRRQAEAVIRTAITHVSNAADNEMYSRNAEHIDKVQYSAILDGRTTPICRSLDGKLYETGKGPRPPQHIGCRSITIPVMQGEEPESLTYADWLRTQSNEEQAEIMGYAKAKLFRDGKLSLDRFVDRRGNELTLDELKAREPGAWESARL